LNERTNLLEAIDPPSTTFSTRFQNTYISWIDYGEPDETQRNGTPVTIEAVPDLFWSSTSAGIRIGENDTLAFSYEVDPE